MSVETFTALNPNRKAVVAGDEDPEDFDWTEQLSDLDLMKLYDRNEVIQIATDWAVSEATREGIEFITDEAITGQKHGEVYQFENRNEFLQWIDFFTEMQYCMKFSELLGTSYMVFYGDEKDLAKESKVYTHCKCFHKFVLQNGMEVKDTDDWGNPTSYTLHLFTEGMKKSKEIEISAKRVIEFQAVKRAIQYGGSSKVRHIGKIALAEEQMLKALIKRAKDEAGGFLKGKARNLSSALIMDQEIGNPNYLKKIYLGEGQDLTYETPDLKANQYFTFFDILSTKFCRALHISKNAFQGDGTGTQSTAKYSFLFTYTTIFQLQKHYHNTLELCFFKLGMKDTRFSWNDPFPEMSGQNAQDETNADGDNGDGTANSDGSDKSTDGDSPNGREQDSTDTSTSSTSTDQSTNKSNPTNSTR